MNVFIVVSTLITELCQSASVGMSDVAGWDLDNDN